MEVWLVYSVDASVIGGTMAIAATPDLAKEIAEDDNESPVCWEEHSEGYYVGNTGDYRLIPFEVRDKPIRKTTGAVVSEEYEVSREESYDFPSYATLTHKNGTNIFQVEFPDLNGEFAIRADAGEVLIDKQAMRDLVKFASKYV